MNRIIEIYIQDCSKELNKETNSNLIDAFIKYTDKITFLIYWLNRIFCYLDRFYTKAKVKITLAKGALNLYDNQFFESIKRDDYKECILHNSSISFFILFKVANFLLVRSLAILLIFSRGFIDI